MQCFWNAAGSVSSTTTSGISECLTADVEGLEVGLLGRFGGIGHLSFDVRCLKRPVAYGFAGCYSLAGSKQVRRRVALHGSRGCVGEWLMQFGILLLR